VSNLNCSIVIPSKKIFEGEVEYISAPGVVGEFGALPGHEKFITILDIGTVSVKINDSDSRDFFIVDGYFEVSDDKVIIIAEEAYTKDEIDISKATQKAEEYKNKLSSLGFNDADYKKTKHKYDKYSKMLKFAS